MKLLDPVLSNPRIMKVGGAALCVAVRSALQLEWLM